MDRALATIFIDGVFVVHALWAIRSAKRARRFRATGRWAP